MRIVWGAAGCPAPVTDGNRHRHFHLLREVARQHSVTVLCPVEAIERPALGALRSLGVEICAVPAEGPQRGRVSAARRRLPACIVPAAIDDLAQAAREASNPPFDAAFGALWMAPAIFAARATHRVLDDQNVESEKYHRLWRNEPVGPRKAARFLDWIEVRRFERSVLAMADSLTVCSRRDAERLMRVAHGRPIDTIRNGVDLDAVRFVSAGRDPATLVIVGSMSYAPNADAARLLVSEVLPRVWRERPEVRAVIVGKAPPPDVRALASERIEVTGEVTSVLPYLHRSALTVLPLRSGGGTRLKVLEAMASGTPVVSTAIGVEGLDLRNHAEAWIGRRPRDLADGVCSLLADPARAAAMALTARRRVERDFGWSAIGLELVSVLERGRGLRAVEHTSSLGRPFAPTSPRLGDGSQP